ncbi:MAG: hypothetical protein GY753_08790, partial [Gammaproteobacteria bacterium]|nr:hypothetical protein [Gammaproteobacteria bacterium]
MLNTANLSLEQAPPISIPLRFFLTAPLFGIAAALLMIWYGPEVMTSRWSPQTLALTHLLTLGVLALVMTGALLQILPVLAGIAVPRVVLVGNLVHPLLTVGTMGLVAGFLLGSTAWLKLAVVALGAGFIIYILAVAVALWRVELPNSTVTGMRMALLALAVTVLLGLSLGAGFAGWESLAYPALYTDVHLTWGMLGWVMLLLIGVSFQVVPMFQVTPEYPGWIRNRLPRLLLVGLAIWTLLYVAAVNKPALASWSLVWLTIILAGYIAFALITLRLQQQRRRKITDVTLMFWRVGITNIPISFLIWGVGRLFPAAMEQVDLDLLLGVCMIFGVAIPLLNGMLYKIVPFLSWFHLQNRQLATMCMTVRVPNMKQFLSD